MVLIIVLFKLTFQKNLTKPLKCGIIVGQGAINFCNTVDVDEDAITILYSEMVKPTYTKTLKENVEYNLEQIEKLFNELIKKNIPWQAIQQKTKILLKELKKVEK